MAVRREGSMSSERERVGGGDAVEPRGPPEQEGRDGGFGVSE